MKLLLAAVAVIAAIHPGQGNNADGWVTKDTPTCDLAAWFEDAMNKADNMGCDNELQEGYPEIGINVSSARLPYGRATLFRKQPLTKQIKSSE